MAMQAFIVNISVFEIDELGIVYGSEISFRIASLETARNPGGVSLFGKGLRNYNQDINVVVQWLALNVRGQNKWDTPSKMVV